MSTPAAAAKTKVPCPLDPPCSVFALQAIEEHGTILGLALLLERMRTHS